IPGEDGRLSLYLAEEHLAQAKGGTARAIFLSTVVRLPDGDVVHLIFIEEARGALEQADQYVHPGGEVGRIDQPGVRRTDNLLTASSWSYHPVVPTTIGFPAFAAAEIF